MKLKLAQSDCVEDQINFIERTEYRYCDTYIKDQGVTFLPTLQKKFVLESSVQIGEQYLQPCSLNVTGQRRFHCATLISIVKAGWIISVMN